MKTKRLTIPYMAKELSREHPKELGIVSVLFFVESVLELFGISLIIPIFNKFLSGSGGSTPNFEWLDEILNFFGLGDKIEYVLLIMCCLYITRGAIMYLSRKMISNTAANILKMHQSKLLHSFLNFELRYFVSKRQGELVNTIMLESPRAALSFLYFSQWVSLVFAILLNITIACMVSYKLAIVAALLGGIMFYPLRFITRECERIGQKTTKYNEELQSSLTESFSMMKFLKASNSEDILERDINEKIKLFTKNYGNTYFFSGAMPIFSNPIGVIVLSIVLYIGVQEGLNVGGILLFIAAFQRLLPNYSTMHGVKNNLLVSYPGFEIIKKVEQENELFYERAGGEKIDEVKNIKINNLNFSHSNGTRVFDNLCLDIPKGKTIALVGPSGHGKTTLVDLILGFYKVNSNQISINSKDINSLDLKFWRSNVSYVTQDSVLFHDSVKNNIVWGVDQVNEQDIIDSIELAGAQFIYDLPKGLDTTVGDRGSSLSGGQRQRVAMARALFKKPKLLILDEATSALDQESELVIKKSIERLKEKTDITIIMVAHRMETVKSADEIIVLRDGNIIEKGSWRDLTENENSFFSKNLANLMD